MPLTLEQQAYLEELKGRTYWSFPAEAKERRAFAKKVVDREVELINQGNFDHMLGRAMIDQFPELGAERCP